MLSIALGATSFSFVACSGAITDDLFEPNHLGYLDPTTGEPESPQLEALSPDTDLVTLTIGGNDVGLVQIIPNCVVAFVGFVPLSGNPQCADDPTLTASTATRLRALAGDEPGTTPQGKPIHSIRSVIEAIHERAPAARILIAGYPHVAGHIGRLQLCHVGRIGLTNLPIVGTADANLILSRANALFGNRLIDNLNAVIREAVEEVAKQGIAVSYVDVRRAFAGHGLCDRFTPWIDDVVGTIDANPLRVRIDRESFHPTAAGQRANQYAFLSALAAP